MVHSFCVDLFASRRHHQRNGDAVCRYSRGLQYVSPYHFLIPQCALYNIFHYVTVAWLFELAGGAISDFEDTCVPKSQREASFTIAALHQWEMEIDDDRCIDSAEEVSLSNAAFSANPPLTSS